MFVVEIGRSEREAKAAHEGVTIIVTTTHVGVLNTIHELELVTVNVVIEAEVGGDVGVAFFVIACGTICKTLIT
jgi:hypothetical protein